MKAFTWFFCCFHSNRYTLGSNGVSMTASSGQPYIHGAPRTPVLPPSSIRSAHTYAANAITSYANGHTLPTVHFSTSASSGAQAGPQAQGPLATSAPAGHVNNGFTAVNLHAATSGSPPNSAMQPLPIQPVRPIQLVQPNQVRPLFQQLTHQLTHLMTHQLTHQLTYQLTHQNDTSAD